MNRPILDPATHASVFCGGISSRFRLNHPEGVIVDPKDGALWCGGEAGELYRVAPDGGSVEQVGGSGGFALGLCMDPERRIYVCDLHHACVVVFDEDGRELARLHGRDGDETLRLPNYPLLDGEGRFLFVSDTRREGGPGIWRFELATGAGGLWMRETCYSANGLALAPDGRSLFLVESHLPGVSRIPIRHDGAAGPKSLVLSLPRDEPDGLAFDSRGRLWISVYNPSRLYRYDPGADRLEVVIEDTSTDLLHHPTNLAFRGDGELFCANLGAWHLTRIDLGALD